MNSARIVRRDDSRVCIYRLLSLVEDISGLFFHLFAENSTDFSDSMALFDKKVDIIEEPFHADK